MTTKRTKAGGKRRAKKSPMDSVEEFEKLLKNVSSVEEKYSLRLYITGTSTRSTLAVSNIRSLCEEYLLGRYELEVVDIYQQPGKAADEQIIAAPTLIKSLPVPPKRLIGDLSNRDKVIVGLNLHNSKTDEETKWSVL